MSLFSLCLFIWFVVGITLQDSMKKKAMFDLFYIITQSNT